jgi:hypothetical protein
MSQLRPAELLSIPDYITPDVERMATAIETYVNKKDHVTFYELENEIVGFSIPQGGEGPYIAIGGPGFIWCCSDDGYQAFKLLMKQRRICISPSPMARLDYVIDGTRIYLFQQDKNWCPVLLRPSKFINYVAAASGLCMNMPKEEISDLKRRDRRNGLKSITV